MFLVLQYDKLAMSSIKSKRIAIIIPTIILVLLVSFYAYNTVKSYTVESKITEIYHKILNREPDAKGFSYYKDQVFLKGKSLEWVETDMAKSPEAISLKITSLYHNVLNRDPDPQGLAYFKDQVLSQNKSLGWVENTMRNSPEAKSK